MKPSMTYYDYVQELRTEVFSELEFHMKKAHFALDVEILILATKSIVRKNLERKT